MKAHERIATLYDRVEVIIYFGRCFSYDKKVWDVTLKWKSDGTEVKVEVKDGDLDEALRMAYDKLHIIAHRGLPSNALAAPVEHEETD